MSIFMPTMPVTASATAEDPFGTLNITPTFSCSAADLNQIYYYVIPSKAPTNYTPPQEALTLFASNVGGCAGANGNTQAIQVYAAQKIGFALKNTTGGVSKYGSNGYSAAQGSVHWFYSSSTTISQDAYSSVTQNCSLDVVYVNGSTTTGSVSNGSCTDTTAMSKYSTFNCGELSGGTLTFNWNDMGGNPDDKDYNDAVYSMNCNIPSSNARGGNGYGLQIMLTN
jgi:hypothetical protein